MAPATQDPRGRPKATSRAMLEEAANELFLEQGYEKTSIDQIAQRAGISRSAFFAYFGSKADVLWFELDQAIERFSAVSASSVAEVVEAIAQAVAPWHSAVPWAIRDADIMGSEEALAAGGASRVQVLHRHLVAGMTPEVGRDAAQLLSGGMVGRIVASLSAWSQQGRGRQPAAEVVRKSLEPFSNPVLLGAILDIEDSGQGLVQR